MKTVIKKELLLSNLTWPSRTLMSSRCLNGFPILLIFHQSRVYNKDTAACGDIFCVCECIFTAIIGWQTSLAGQECQQSAHDVTAVYICPSCPAIAGQMHTQCGDAEKDKRRWWSVVVFDRCARHIGERDLVVCVGVLWWLLIGQILRRGQSPLSDLNLSFVVWRHHMRSLVILGKCK